MRDAVFVCGRRGVSCALMLLGVLALACAASGGATETAPLKVAVYSFELDDFSAGGGIIAPDARDIAYLEQSTREAERLLAGSGRFTPVDTSSATDEPVRTHTMRSCGGCVGPITQRLGADVAVLGIITRINRTEFTLRMQFLDARDGKLLADHFTGLRMGANYAWPRGVTWLIKNRILAAPEARR